MRHSSARPSKGVTRSELHSATDQLIRVDSKTLGHTRHTFRHSNLCHGNSRVSLHFIDIKGDPLLGYHFQYHATFCVNSVAHYIGSQPYGGTGTARDSFITAMLSLGEGYHNFHHRFQSDFRNGFRWYHFDPTKWFIFAASKVGLTWNLKRTPGAAIMRAREAVAAGT